MQMHKNTFLNTPDVKKIFFQDVHLELRLVAPVQGGLCHKALAVLYVPIQVGPVY